MRKPRLSGGAKVLASQVVGENRKNADLVVSPWPSDHRAVLSTFRIGKD